MTPRKRKRKGARSVTITEIIEREVVKALECGCDLPGRDARGRPAHDPFCAGSHRDDARAACHAVAKAVVEECAALIDDSPCDMWRERCGASEVARRVRALLTSPEPAGERK
jgi:hypothetical protein